MGPYFSSNVVAHRGTKNFLKKALAWQVPPLPACHLECHLLIRLAAYRH